MEDRAKEELPAADGPFAPTGLAQSELIWAASKIIGLGTDGADGGDVRSQPVDELHWVITACMYTVDRCLKELARRGELKLNDQGIPIVPYNSDHFVKGVTLPKLVVRSFAAAFLKGFDPGGIAREQNEGA
jgi:hypothetical protein